MKEKLEKDLKNINQRIQRLGMGGTNPQMLGEMD